MSSNGHHRPSRGSLASESSNTSSQHSPRTLTHPLRTSQRSEAVNSPSGTFDTTSIKPPENGDQQVIGRRDTYSHLQEQYLETPFKFCLCQPDPKIPRPRNGKHKENSYLNAHCSFPAFELYTSVTAIRPLWCVFMLIAWLISL